MSDLYIDALGIGEEVAQLRATLPRGKRSKILDEDFHPTLYAMKEDESARVITAVRQATSSRHILEKLLQRIVMTDDISVHKACVKLHGFVILAGVLDEWADDQEIVSLALRCLAKWPLLARDKVVDAGVDAQVRRFAESDSPAQELAQSLLEAWDQLETTFRIARRLQTDEAQDTTETPKEDYKEQESWAARRRAEAEAALRASMAGHAPSTVSKDLKALLGYRQADEAVPKNVAKPAASRPPPAKVDQPKLVPSESIDDIIRKAYEANEAEQQKAAQQAEEAAKAAQDALQKQEAKAAKRMEKANKKDESGKRPPSSSENGTGKEKRSRPEKQHTDRGRKSAITATPAVDLKSAERQLAKQVGALVVKQLSKVKQDLDTPRFKRHAKQLTQILCDKERKNPKTWPPHSDVVDLSDEKRKKMKLFAHDYIKKLVQHQHAKQTRDMSEGLTGDVSSHENDTPNADMSIDLSFAVDGPILQSERSGLQADPDMSETNISQMQSGTSPIDSYPEDSRMEDASHT